MKRLFAPRSVATAPQHRGIEDAIKLNEILRTTRLFSPFWRIPKKWIKKD
jgi:hypothetical protein